MTKELYIRKILETFNWNNKPIFMDRERKSYKINLKTDDIKEAKNIVREIDEKIGIKTRVIFNRYYGSTSNGTYDLLVPFSK